MKGPPAFDRIVFTLAIILALVALAFAMTGCATTNEARTGQSHTVTEHHLLADGGFVEKKTTYDSSDTTISTKADVDWQGAVSTGIGQAASGNWLGLAITAGSALAAGGAAVVKHREAMNSRKSEDEAWEKLLAEKDKANA